MPATEVSAPTSGRATRAQLVINGYPLLLRHKGAGVYTARLIQALERRWPGRFRAVVPEALRADLTAEFSAENFDFIPGRPPLARGVAADIYWNLAIMRHITRRYPRAVVHAPAETWSPRRPRRLVTTLYDCIYRHYPRLRGGWLRRWWWRATERYASRADRVLTISEHSRRELVQLAGIPADRLRVIHPWVDTFAARARAADAGAARVVARYDLPPEFLLYAGGYNINKNVERLVAGYARASGKAPLPPLVLIGGIPPADPRLAVCDVHGAIAASGLPAGCVRLPGPVATADMATVMQRAKLLVHPALHEGFGYAPAEAMAVGTPVLVANATSLVEVVREPHCRFDPMDVDAIAAKLLDANAAPAKFRVPLPPEFTEAAGMTAYLATLDECDHAPGHEGA
ncbi:MAG TPA: glycosyltransferase family 1 protein [Opitutus sp.]|nr:glycosyltransferase family 1 protein [Opitutus sp.]